MTAPCDSTVIPVRIAELDGRIDKVEQAQKGHEDVCAERYRGIREDIRKLNSQIAWSAALLVTIVIGTLGWSLKSQWDAQQQTIHMLTSIYDAKGVSLKQ